MSKAGVPSYSSHVTPSLAAIWEVVALVQSFYPSPHADCGDIWCARTFDLPPAPPLLLLFAAVAPEPHESGVPGAQSAGGPGCAPLL